jgi:septal ring factor EnvC (AmiA/AmiB activator)
MILAIENFTPTMQQWAVLALLAALLVIWLVARWKSRPLDLLGRTHRREIDSAHRETEEVRRDLAELLRELERLSAKITTQLDDKYARLQDTIRDADQRIFALRALHQAITTHANPEAAAPSPAAPAIETPAEPDSLNSRVHALADQGLTPLEIAGRVEHPIGEVQLILNLRAAAVRSSTDA